MTQTTAAGARTIDWYERRDELEPEQVFRCQDGAIVKLDRSVPGDATKWYVADWYGRSWSYEDGTIEPGDLQDRLTVAEIAALAKTGGAA